MHLSRALKISVSLLGIAGIIFFLVAPGVFSAEQNRVSVKLEQNPYSPVYSVTDSVKTEDGRGAFVSSNLK